MLTDAAVAEFVDLADKAIKEITVVALIWLRVQDYHLL